MRAFLVGLLLLVTGCGVTDTVRRYEVRQSAWLADPGPRSVGKLAEDGEWHLEAGYERTLVREGPSRLAGGNGHAPSADSLHLRVARGVAVTDGPGFEASLWGQVGLTSGNGSADMGARPNDAGPRFAGVAGRVRSSATDAGALVFTIEASAGFVPFLREIEISGTSTTTWPDEAGMEARTDLLDGHEREEGERLAVRSVFGLHGDLLPDPGWSLQLGAFFGSAPYAEGYFATTERCSGPSCTGDTPAEHAVLATAWYVMPSFTATIPLEPGAIVISAWIMAASTARLEESTPLGLSLSLRLGL